MTWAPLKALLFLPKMGKSFKKREKSKFFQLKVYIWIPLLILRKASLSTACITKPQANPIKSILHHSELLQTFQVLLWNFLYHLPLGNTKRSVVRKAHNLRKSLHFPENRSLNLNQRRQKTVNNVLNHSAYDESG